MGTEVAISFSSLRAQLENEKSNLFKIDENIKKIVLTPGRFPNDRFNSSGDYTRGGARLGGRNSFPDATKNEDSFGKRKHETKTVFSRISARTQDSDGEEEGQGIKRGRMPSAVSRELPTRAAVLRAQGDDEQARTRNRRIFGSLLGTLQKFKQEEIVLQTKEDKKAQVERKIEEQARLEKEREIKQRKTLYVEREHKKATIKALEAKMGRVQEFEKWETSQKSLGNFILTKSKPHIYWLPNKMTPKAVEKLNSSRKYHETKYGRLYRKCMAAKRQELQEELQRIEQRCLRPRGFGAKENDPNDVKTSEVIPWSQNKDSVSSSELSTDIKKEDDKARKRDKFAMDVDDKEGEDSDGEDAQEAPKLDDSQNDIGDIQLKEDESDENKVEAENSKAESLGLDLHDVTMVSVEAIDPPTLSESVEDTSEVVPPQNIEETCDPGPAEQT